MTCFLPRRRTSATSLTRCFAPLALTILWALAFSAPARAHDPFETFTSVVIHPDRMELSIGMAQSTALRLIDPAVRITALTPENMAEHRPRLLHEGALLFVFTSLRTRLGARKVEVELTDENDIFFQVTYPRPAPGRLLVHAAYLRRLGDGFGGIFALNDPTGKNLGWEQLLWAQPNFEVTVSASVPPKP
jgi:hypothetical protein